MRRAVQGEKLKDGAGSLALRDINEPGQDVEVCEEETIRLQASMLMEPHTRA